MNYRGITWARITCDILRSSYPISTPGAYGEGEASLVDDEIWAIYLYFEATARVRVATAGRVREITLGIERPLTCN